MILKGLVLFKKTALLRDIYLYEKKLKGEQDTIHVIFILDEPL